MIDQVVVTSRAVCLRARQVVVGGPLRRIGAVGDELGDRVVEDFDGPFAGHPLGVGEGLVGFGHEGSVQSGAENIYSVKSTIFNEKSNKNSRITEFTRRAAWPVDGRERGSLLHVSSHAPVIGPASFSVVRA